MHIFILRCCDTCSTWTHAIRFLDKYILFEAMSCPANSQHRDFCSSLSSIHFLQETGAKIVKITFGGNGVNTENNMCFSCFRISVEKSIVSQDKRGKSHVGKSAKSTSDPADLFGRQTWERIFPGQHGDTCTKMYPKSTKNGPKKYPADIAMTPENI